MKISNIFITILTTFVITACAVVDTSTPQTSTPTTNTPAAEAPPATPSVRNTVIKFDSNNPSATGTMTDRSGAPGSTITLPNNGFTLYCNQFLGWSTSQTGPVEYPDASSFTIPATDRTLYAQWSPKSMTVNYSITLNLIRDTASDTVSTAVVSPPSALPGTSITVTASSKPGYRVANLTAEIAGVGNKAIDMFSEATSFTMPNDNVVVTLRFVPKRYISFASSTITSCPAGMKFESTSASTNAGATVNLRDFRLMSPGADCTKIVPATLTYGGSDHVINSHIFTMPDTDIIIKSVVVE